MIRPTTGAFSFSPPEELNERMMLCTAWAYLRRGSLLVREVHPCRLILACACAYRLQLRRVSCLRPPQFLHGNWCCLCHKAQDSPGV